MSKILDQALYYLEVMQFAVIPQKPDKQPYIHWQEYQKKMPSTDEVKDWFERFPDAMIAIVTGKVSGITVIDIDTTEGFTIIDKILPDNIKCPVAITPSGGRHLYFQYCPELVTRSRDLPGIDTKSDGGLITAPPSINAEGKKYTWLKNFHIGDVTLPPVPQKYIDEVQKYHAQVNAGNFSMNSSDAFNIGNRDQTIFHVAHTLVKGGMELAETQEIVARIANSCSPPFPKTEAMTKVKSAVERAYRKERNLMDEVRQWVALTSGWFNLTQVFQSLPNLTQLDRNAIHQIAYRLRKADLLEKHPSKHGVYRRMEDEKQSMDYKGARPVPLGVDWPLGIGEFFEIYAKNVCMIVGTKDAGKTAFFFDFIKRNQSKAIELYDKPITFLSSEMGEEELRMRLDLHEDMTIGDWSFEAFERGDNFGQAVEPNGINIIDYLEINKDFPEIGDKIKEIHRRLERGIALIGLQKNYGVALGRGAAFSIQRPRLYLTLEYGVAKILSAKNRKAGASNPVGKVLNYKLVNGWKIIPQGLWHDSYEGEFE